MGRKAPSAAPLLITLDANGGHPIFQQIFDGIRDAILSGRLKRGQQVPSTRLLASELGIARSTVVLADHVAVAAAPTGMHLVAWLRGDIDDRRASRLAEEAGIEASPLSLYCLTASHPPALLLGYAAVNEQAIAEAVRRLRDALAVATP